SGTFGTLSGCSACLEGLGYIAILSVVGSALAVIVFNYLIKISSPLFSSSVTYMIPVFAIGWGIIDGERGTWIDLSSVVIILAGVYLVNHKPKSAEKHE
ncbi:MAG: DMT family transporter, partial [Bacteroidetes bacterium]|nr:DMT family transporter [Bacteroidota bacterium]